MSLLRSSKFVRYFVNIARNIVIVQPKNVDKALLERSRSLINSGIDRSLVTEAGPNPNINPIDKSIKRLDQDVRRTGRISRKELLDVFDEIRHTRQATGTQCLLIIRCCGNLVPEESPEVRTRLVNEIWDTFEKIGVSLDISHYNALLRVYLENEHQFSPTEFLTMLENKGVEPNRVTFQRLISAYCQRGDIEGATRILEFMKQKQIPVNESVFNSLIVGHSQADDMDSAVGILGVMNQANIEPSADTYTALLCGYARRGDIENITSILKECKDKGVELLDKDVLDVAFTLAINNHSEHLDEVLGYLRKTFGYNQDAKNIILRLLVKGEDDAAIKVLRTMTPLQSTGIAEKSGSFLVKQMVKLNRPFERIVSFCAALKESGENEYALHHALETSLVTGINPETSLKLLSVLSAQEAVCQHYYWPVLVQYGKAKNSQGLYSTLRQLSKEVGQSVSGETLKDYVLPYMTSSTIQGIQELRQAGITLASAAAATVAALLADGNIHEATRIALHYRANYCSLLIRRSLVNAFLATKDVQNFVTMIKILMEGDSNKDEDDGAVADVLLEVVESLRGEDKIKLITDILQGYLDNGIGLSNETAESLQNSLSGEELTHEISTLLAKLTSPDLVPKGLHRPPHLIKPSDNKTEEFLLNQIKDTESDVKANQSVRKDLLLLYCRSRELEKAQEIYNKLEGEGYNFTFGHLASLMELYVQFDMLDEATKFYNRSLELNTDSDMDDTKLVKYAFLLSKNDKLEEALNLFKKHNSRTSQKLFSHTSLCWKLLNCFAEKGGVKLLKELFNAMKEKGFLEPSNVLLGPLIKVHLINDDLAGALDQFEECCTLYRATPWKNELACRLIQNEDATSLQRLTDLSTQIHGEMNSLYDLVLSFIECGRIRQARKILETPGLRSRAQRINSACEKYTNEGKANHLESLVEATKDLSHIDRAEIYYHLLKTYCKTDEVDKAIGLWTQMQEEDVQPSDNFLSTLGELMKRHNRPVPFAIPQVKEKVEIYDKEKIPQEKQAKVKSLRKAIYAKDVDEALDLKNSLNDSDLSLPDKTKLLNLLTNSGRLREASSLLIGWLENNQKIFSSAISNHINTLAKLGDVDSVEEIGKHLNKELRKAVSYVNRHAHCMVEAGRAEEILIKLLDDIKNAKTSEEFIELGEEFPRGGIFPILKVHPQFLPKVEEISTEYRKRGLLEPTNIMWIHYFMNDDVAKEEEYWSYLKSNDRLMFIPILKLCRVTLEDAKLISLINRCKEANLEEPVIALVHSTLIDVYIKQHRLGDCEKILDEYLESNKIEYLSRSTMQRAKRYFESSNKEFKYPLPPEKTRKERTQESSSSSDSDTEERK